jgi:PTS system nitrogen regulatory IIA component
MPYRNFTLKQIAHYLGLNVQEAERLAQKGELPGERVCGNWRFNKIRIVEWLQQTMHTLDETRLKEIEGAMKTAADDDPAAEASRMVVTELIGLHGICLDLPARTRRSVLIELVKLSECTGMVYDKDALIDALEQREEMCSTAITNGVAIPHPRRPLPYATSEPIICVGRVNGGIGFGAPDGKLTRLFFLICCHEDSHHLHVLARLMRILDAATVRNLMSLQAPEEFLEAMIARETVINSGGK